MKLSSLPIAAFAISIFLASSSPVDARPVTAADLSGNMICWSNGHIQSFEADGRSAGADYADGKWSVDANGVRIDVSSGGGANVDMEIQPDGTFTFEAKNGGETKKGTGKVCKTKPYYYADAVGKKLCWDGGDVETDYPGGKFVDSVEGEAIVYNVEGDLSNFEWKYNKYDKVFKGKQLQLEDGRVVYRGSGPGVDYCLGVAVFCK
jgi:hypothetical protein